jgi:hypothetical protein
MDNLEKFIVDNREAFNDADPNPLMWLDIEKQLEKRKKSRVIKLYRYAAVAASFILVLGMGMLIGLNMNQNADLQSLAENDQYQEFQQAEMYFQKQVNVKMDLLKEYPAGKEVEDDLSQLDAVYNEMKAELLSSPNKDNSAIIQAMIENYQIRINMLEKILNNIQDKSQYHEENISL